MVVVRVVAVVVVAAVVIDRKSQEGRAKGRATVKASVVDRDSHSTTSAKKSPTPCLNWSFDRTNNGCNDDIFDDHDDEASECLAGCFLDMKNIFSFMAIMQQTRTSSCSVIIDD